MDSSELSALAAWAAAAVTLMGAGFQFFIGRKQANAALISANAALRSSENAGRHKIAEFRQAWINKIIEILSEHHGIISSIPAVDVVGPDDKRKLAGLRTELAILLNPNEPDTVALLDTIQRLDQRQADNAFTAAQTEMLTVARRLLKTEWVRIKDELGFPRLP